MAALKKDPPKADFYHTGEIVLRLARDKRTSRLLFFGSLVSVGAIVGFFYAQEHGFGPPLPSPPPPSAASLPPKTEPVRPTSVRTPFVPPAAPPAPPHVSPATVAVQVSTNKSGTVWVGGKPMGVVKKSLDLALIPGTYEIKMRFGRKVVSEKVLVLTGAPVSVRFDGYKKKVVVKGQ